jgi:hypothetical protein
MSARLEASRFPQLSNQVRTSTGYTHAPGGVVRQAPPIARVRAETPVIRDVSIAPKKKRGRPRKARGDL